MRAFTIHNKVSDQLDEFKCYNSTFLYAQQTDKRLDFENNLLCNTLVPSTQHIVQRCVVSTVDCAKVTYQQLRAIRI